MSLLRNNKVNHYIDEMINSNNQEKEWNEELLSVNPFGDTPVMIKNQSIINSIENIFNIAIDTEKDLNKPLISLTDFGEDEFETLIGDFKMEIFNNFDYSDILTMHFNDNISISKIIKLIN